MTVILAVTFAHSQGDADFLSVILPVGAVLALIIGLVRTANRKGASATSEPAKLDLNGEVYTRPLPSPPKTIELQPEEIDFLSAFVRPRSQEYLRLTGADWDSKLPQSWEDTLRRLTDATLLKPVLAPKTRETRIVVTTVGARVVAEHSSDPKARSTALRKL